jgi:type I restriction enzyme S subunit
MAHEYTSSGIPVLRGVNVNRGRFHDDEFVFISEEKANQLSKFESYPKDVLLVHKGTLGPIGLMPGKRRYSRYILGNSMMRVRCDPTKLLPEYLYYWLSSPDGQHYLFSRVSQVGVPQLQTPLTTLRQATLPGPSLLEQLAITDILGKMDDKIELDERMNQNLQAIAHAIFKRWFIDFEYPNEGGNAYKSSGGEMVYDEELGTELPKGWRVGNILDCASILSGGTPRTEVAEYWGGKIPWVSAKDVTNSNSSFILDTEKKITQLGIDNSSTKLLPKNTTVVTARGVVGSYCILSREMAINQTNYGFKAKSGYSDFFVFFSISSLVTEMKARSYGTIFDTITTKTFEDMKIPIPPTSVITSFEGRIDHIMARILVNLQESHTLAAIRDALLPKLMSGTIRVPMKVR